MPGPITSGTRFYQYAGDIYRWDDADGDGKVDWSELTKIGKLGADNVLTYRADGNDFYITSDPNNSDILLVFEETNGELGFQIGEDALFGRGYHAWDSADVVVAFAESGGSNRVGDPPELTGNLAWDILNITIFTMEILGEEMFRRVTKIKDLNTAFLTQNDEDQDFTRTLIQTEFAGLQVATNAFGTTSTTGAGIQGKLNETNENTLRYTFA